MDRKLLEKMLVENKVPSDMYSLQGGLPNEAYCIDKIDGKWEVYYLSLIHISEPTRPEP